MMIKRFPQFWPILLLPGLSVLGGSKEGADRMKSVGLLANLGGNAAKSFAGSNVWLQAAGVAATVLLIEGNADYGVNRYFHEHRSYGNFFHPVVSIGTFMTPVFGAVCYFGGMGGSDPELKGLGSALLQSQILTSLYIGVLKGVTGRPHPTPDSGVDMKKLSRKFRFGFLRGGLFWGWPSGHTASAMALVSTLTAFYPEKTWLKIGGGALVAYTMAGVSAVGGGHMHWFSDAVAAAFMTYAIGHTVGAYYHRRVFDSGSSPAPPGKIQMSADPLSTFPVVRVVYTF
jgi:membrane-associated phospholipid phosphatase